MIAVNAPAFKKAGTVGRLLPFVEPRLEPVPGIEDGARLCIAGRTSCWAIIGPKIRA